MGLIRTTLWKKRTIKVSGAADGTFLPPYLKYIAQLFETGLKLAFYIIKKLRRKELRKKYVPLMPTTGRGFFQVKETDREIYDYRILLQNLEL